MGEPNYSNLTPTEFEALAKDVMTRIFENMPENPLENQILYRFSEGRDGGVDLTEDSIGGEIVVQCKRFTKEGSKEVKNALLKEVKKIEKMNPKPKKYFIFTSGPLMKAHLAEIREEAAKANDNDNSIMPSDAYIIFGETIKDFFNDPANEDVYEKHMKLFVSHMDWYIQKLLTNDRKRKYNDCKLLCGKEVEARNVWNEKLFLEKEDGKTLSEVYVEPKFKLEDAEKNPFRMDIQRYLKGMIQRIDDEEKDFQYKYSEKRLSLILGTPGSGKSTLFTKFLNWNMVFPFETEYDEDALVSEDRRVYLYRFSDMNSQIKWREDNGKDKPVTDIMNQMLRWMGAGSHMDLANTILLLDGFDECSASESQRVQLLSEMAKHWGKIARIFITCRHGYVSGFGDLMSKNISIISLQNFDQDKIGEFTRKYKNLNLTIEDTTEIYGIPLILYMVLAMGDEIQLRSDKSIGRIYDEIFRLDQGIYDRMLYNKKYDALHENKNERFNKGDDFAEYKAYLDKISRLIAFFMFDNGGENQAEYKSLAEFLEKEAGFFKDADGQTVDFHTVLASGLFMYVDANKNEEGTVRFVHKTMYEYFVAYHIWKQIESYLLEKDMRKIHIALVKILRKGTLTLEILDNFLKYKLSDERLKIGDMEAVFASMINRGLLYYDGRPAEGQLLSEYELAIDNLFFGQIAREINLYNQEHIFNNMIYLIQALRQVKGGNKILFEDNFIIKNSFSSYLRMKQYRGDVLVREKDVQGTGRFDLSCMNLSEMDLSHANLRYFDFTGSLLENTDFSHSDLTGCDFTGAILRGARFTEATMVATEPSVNVLLDDMSLGIPWTKVHGYYPEKYHKKSDEFKNINESNLQEGDLVPFGTFGPDKETITWKVLEIEGGKALLLSEKILALKPYQSNLTGFLSHKIRKKFGWSGSSLNEWLNDGQAGGFLYEAFSSEERGRICTSLVEPDSLIEESDTTLQGVAISAKIFLLSEAEVLRYFAKEELSVNFWISMGGDQAAAKPTDYAKQENGGSLWVHPGNGNANWWLRTVSSYSEAKFVDASGEIPVGGHHMISQKIGVRPAMWIKL